MVVEESTDEPVTEEPLEEGARVEPQWSVQAEPPQTELELGEMEPKAEQRSRRPRVTQKVGITKDELQACGTEVKPGTQKSAVEPGEVKGVEG